MKKNKFDQEIEKVELSDPELQEIENWGKEGDEENELETNLKENDQELLCPEKGQEKNQSKIQKKDQTQKEKPNQKSETLKQKEVKTEKVNSLIEIEGTYHSIDLFFGESLIKEIEEDVKNLKEKYSKDQNFLDFITYLNKKEFDLLKFKSLVQKKLENGEIDENKYLQILQKTFDKNQLILQQAVLNKIQVEQIERIKKRLNIIQQEKEEINKYQKENQIEENDTENQLNQQKQQENMSQQKTEQKLEKAEDPSKKKQTQKESQAKQIIKQDSIGSNPVVIYLVSKISKYICFQEYLTKHFKEERQKDLEQLSQLIEKMRERMKEVKKDPSQFTVDELGTEFKDLSPELVMGMDRKQRNKKIEETINEIKKDIAQVKHPQLLEVYKQHYLPMIKNLVEIRDSLSVPSPLVIKKKVEIPFIEVNKNIKSGHMILKIGQMKEYKKDCKYFLNYKFDYESKTFSDKTDYQNSSGSMNYQKELELEDGIKINKKFCQQQIFFVLSRKTFGFFTKEVGKGSMSFEKLKNYNEITNYVDIIKPNKKIIQIEISIQITKALDKPMKQLQLYHIEKIYPTFNIQENRQQKDQESNVSTKQTSQQSQQITSELSANSNQQQKQQPSQKYISQKQEQQKVQTLEKQNQSTQQKNQDQKNSQQGSEPKQQENTFKSKYKFPILKFQRKQILQQLVQKNNMPQIYIDYQDKIFCLTFLEELLKELDSQIQELAAEGESQTRQEAERIMLNAGKYQNYLSGTIQNGGMSMEDYKSKIDNFIKLDETALKFYEKIKFWESVYFISNRMEIMKNEAKELEENMKQ